MAYKGNKAFLCGAILISALFSGCSQGVVSVPDQQDIETVRIALWFEPFDFDAMNQVLEEKNYPYRVEFIDMGGENNENFDLTRKEQFIFMEETLQNTDIMSSYALKSYNKWYYEDGLLSELDDSLIDLLPKDMFRTIEGNIVEFPSNFMDFVYPVGKTDLYYAIVKEDIATENHIETMDDLYAYMLSHTDYSIANPIYYDLPGKDDFESGWYTGIMWDEENERFYNPYLEEDDYMQMLKYIGDNISDINFETDEVSDIIFESELLDGYVGIEYQPYLINNFTTTGLLFSKDCSEYAQQFIYDLYTDADLTKAALEDYFDGVYTFGNLELLDQEILKKHYDVDSFSYEEYVNRLSSKKSKLFDTQIYLSDVMPQDEIFEILEKNIANYISGFPLRQENIDRAKASFSGEHETFIAKLNDLYARSK